MSLIKQSLEEKYAKRNNKLKKGNRIGLLYIGFEWQKPATEVSGLLVLEKIFIRSEINLKSKLFVQTFVFILTLENC